MGVTSDLTSQKRCEAVVILAQADPDLASQPDQLASCRLLQTGIRRVVMFFSFTVVSPVPRLKSCPSPPGALPSLDCLGPQPFNPFFTDPLAPRSRGRRTKRQTVLKERLPIEVLSIWVLGPSPHDRLVRKRKDMSKVKNPCDQTRQGRRATGVKRKETGPLPFEDIPVNQGFQLHQFMSHVDHLDQPGA